MGPASGPASPGSCASDQVWNRVYKANSTFKVGDVFSVTMLNTDPNTNNKIYGCGQDTIQIKSIFSDNHSANWPSINPWPPISSSTVTGDSQQALWTDTTQHYCLNSTTDINSTTTISQLYKSQLLKGLNYSLINTNLLPAQPIPYIDSPTSTASNPLPAYRQPSDMLSWYQASNGPCMFSARSSGVSTGLYVQDGDELTISWSGNYSAYPSYSSPLTPSGSTTATGIPLGLPLDQSIMCARNAAINPNYTVSTDWGNNIATNANYCQQWANMQSNLRVSFNDSNANLDIDLNGESARTDPIFTKGKLSPTKINVKGLQGSVHDDPNPILNNPYGGALSCTAYWQGGACPDGSINCSSCSYINGSNSLGVNGTSVIGDIAYSTYNYQGVLKGAAATRKMLSIGMVDSPGAHTDNVGGVDATITWGGCPTTPSSTDSTGKPNAMQYLVADCNLDPNQMYDSAGYILNTTTAVPYTWTSIPLNTQTPPAANTQIRISNNGACTGATCCVYLRVQDPYISQDQNGSVSLSSTAPAGNSFPPLWGSSKVGLQNLYGNPGNRYGYYSLALGTPSSSFSLPSVNLPANGTSGGPLQGMVQYVNKTIIGTMSKGYSDGVLKTFYENVIRGKGYQSFVMALLSLYMSFLGLGFIMGTVKIDLREMVTRMVKVAFVIALISDTSWTMFSTYILPAVVNGAAELASSFVINVAQSTNMSSNFPAGYANAIATDPSVIIALMVEQPLQYIWGSHILWLKVGAIMLSAWWGFLFCIMLIVSIIVYSIGLIKIVMIYCLTLIGVGVMIFIAPLVIPMILFKFTESVFDKWWKMLLSYAMQPVLLFAGVSILNFLTLAVFYASLSYTICPYCILSFPFFGTNGCLLTIYVMLDSLHSPSSINGFIPSGLITSSTLFLLLSYAMFEMPSVFTGMATKLITGSSIGNVGDSSNTSFNRVGLGSASQLPGTAVSAAGNIMYAANAAAIVGSAANRFVNDLSGDGRARPPIAPVAPAADPVPAAVQRAMDEGRGQTNEMPKSLAELGGPKKASAAPSLLAIAEEDKIHSTERAPTSPSPSASKASAAPSLSSIAEGDEDEED